MFYSRNKENEAVKLIKVYLKGRDVGTAVVDILKACDLPTAHVEHYAKTDVQQQEARIRAENIKRDGDEWIKVKYKNEYDFTKMDKNHPLWATFVMQQKIKEAKDNLR